ncbi:WW domain binding protein 11-domain-containing protein [Parasitella parasitica]|nr:WW domain binding protein 11-domain-containing protein [Parasitella parasitica]
MGKSKRSMNPADALRKQQRKRELKKNKEDRKRVRESALAKKDIGKVRQEMARLEHLSNMGQLDKAGQTRLDQLKSEIGKIEKAKKATELTGAQAAYAARMQEQEKKHDGEARKLVYDPNRGAFVPAKIKEKAASASTKEGEEGDSSNSDSSSDGSEDSDQSEDDISVDEEEETQGEEIPLPAAKVLTESDDEYEIPLPPGPPPYRPFEEQLNPIIQQQFRNPPPPPPPGGPLLNRHRMHQVPPPPPPNPYGFRPPQMMAAPPPPPPIMSYQQFSAPVHYPQPQPQPRPQSTSEQPQIQQPASAPVISAEPQLRDLEKETLAFVPAAIRRKQNAAHKRASLPKEARPHIDAAP